MVEMNGCLAKCLVVWTLKTKQTDSRITIENNHLLTLFYYKTKKICFEQHQKYALTVF